MKKLCVGCISLCSILFLACNFGLKKDFATVQIDFGASSPLERALDSATALPILSSTRIKIETEGSISGYSAVELPPQAPKNISLNLPVGDTVVIKVSAYNPSGIWSGSVTHRVEEGANAVSVKLGKKVSGLNKLLFTQKKTVNEMGHTNYDLTLYLGGKKIDLIGSEASYSFARDSLGRVLVGYTVTNLCVDRYTSEGNLDVNGTVMAADSFANDYTTGKMYAHISNDNQLVQIEDNLSGQVVAMGLDGRVFAADNGRIAWVDTGSQLLKVAPIPNSVSSLGTHFFGTQIDDDIEIDDCEPSEVTDLFMRGSYVYVLFTTEYKLPGFSNPFYIFGGVVRYNVNDLGEEPVKIGFDDPDIDTDDHTFDKSYYAQNFYGAVKVIGFDDDNIYIADDGFDSAYVEDGYGHHHLNITADRNRIAALNIRTNSLSFTDAAPAKWFNEWTR
ncbi:hypothetical protein H0R92_08330 [Treponema sp. OMZ 840]|uniref:hypothetical protein n=1 Tax=Treponema sp. OMZ 840 TaxID=244313 RepID=UPI003D92D9C1